MCALCMRICALCVRMCVYARHVCIYVPKVYMYMRIDTPFCESKRYLPMTLETLKDT